MATITLRPQAPPRNSFRNLVGAFACVSTSDEIAEAMAGSMISEHERLMAGEVDHLTGERSADDMLLLLSSQISGSQSSSEFLDFRVRCGTAKTEKNKKSIINVQT